MAQIRTGIDESPVLETTLQMPYTLTTGRAVSMFIAQLGKQVITGSRCDACERTVVPAQDYCSRCGGDQSSFVPVSESGVVTAVTVSGDRTTALIRLDGVDADLVHLVDGGAAAVAVGDRVKAVWAEDPVGSILDLAFFAPAGPAESPAFPGGLAEIPEDELTKQIDYSLSLPYQHAYGANYGRLFDELGARAGIIGSRCPRCRNVLVPPRAYCEICYVKTEQFVEVQDTGRLQAFSVIHMEFVGQTRKPPYVYAEIVLEGSATRMIHTLGGIDMSRATELLDVGMRVRAVWKAPDERNGTLDDIDYFEPIESFSDDSLDGLKKVQHIGA